MKEISSERDVARADAPPLEAAGYVDLQVNGYGGVDLNKDALTADELHAACARLEADDVALCLVAIITDDLDHMCRRLARLAALRAADPLAQRLIAGFHIEGPFINGADGFRGAHPAAGVRVGDPNVMMKLLDAADGLTRVVTLAPECDPRGLVTRLLVRHGVVVSAGHTDATADELRAAIDAGVSMFTHVGNGCPMHLHRHDNIVQRALSLAESLWLCFIADGAHVPFVALRNYFRLAGTDRTIVVSDAMAAAGLGPGRYTLGHQAVVVLDDLVAWAPDRTHFVGSATTLARSAGHLRTMLGLSEEAVRQMTSVNARTALAL